MVAGTMDVIQQQMITNLNALNPGKAADVRSLVVDVLMPEFRERAHEMTGPLLLMLGSTLTVVEMDDLAAFYSTPLGQKALSTMRRAFLLSQTAPMDWFRFVAEEVFAKHEQTIRARGIRF